MSIRRFAWILACLALCAAWSPPPAFAQERPSGTVTMEFGHGGFVVSASGGHGTLHFRGRSYAFNLGSLGVGGIGVAKVHATGEVYNLARIEDFPGNYLQARAGYAAGEGKGVLRLQNSEGVVLKLHTRTKGLALQLGADGLRIEMAKAGVKKRPAGK